jgi:uncharacterized protein
MREFKLRLSHSPRPMPEGRWAMTQRWNDLLFAHWPVPAASIGHLLPEGLQPDTHNGTAWIGVVPFWMDRIRLRGVPPIPGARSFPELNLRTYVRDQHTGVEGVYFFSLDGGNLLAAAVARAFYHLPYYWAEMRHEQQSEREFVVYSRRRLSGSEVIFKARYRGLGPSLKLAEPARGSLEHFLTERFCLFAENRSGELVEAQVQHSPWALEDAEADIERNDLPAVIGLELPADQAPVLHYARRQAVYLWPIRVSRSIARRQPIPAQALPFS